jgi:hypothetical protein
MEMRSSSELLRGFDVDVDVERGLLLFRSAFHFLIVVLKPISFVALVDVVIAGRVGFLVKLGVCW